MVNGDDESEVKQRRAQDLIETVAPPRGKRSGDRTRDALGWSDATADSEWLEGRVEHESIVPALPISPDEIPTERPPWTDPVESREHLIRGVPIPSIKKNA